eukprot:g5502.t1
MLQFKSGRSDRVLSKTAFLRTPMALRIRCSGIGFGDKDVPPQGDRKKRRETKKDVQEALRSLKGRKTRPIDPKEAAQGKLDVATVKQWGNSGKLGDLEVASFRSKKVVDPSAPLHVRLAKTLELLETSGDLSCGQSGLLPFEEWDFAPVKYAEVLNNLASVHGAFEDSVEVILEYLVDEQKIGDFDIKGLKLFSSEQRLNRASALQQDFQRFLENTPELDSVDISPTAKATDYVKLIEELRDEVLIKKKDENRVEAVCKLLTHGYLLRITHFTSGSRVASAAVEKLDLIPKKAVSATQDYPEEIYDPVRSFIDATNTLGRLLSEDQTQIMFDELPKAFTNTAILFESLAKAPRELKI